MREFGRYVLLHFKRTCRTYAVILALVVLLLAVIGAAGCGMLLEKKNDVSFQKVRLGLVGDGEDEMLQMGLSLMQMVDNSRFTVEIIPLEGEKEAVNAMQTRRIDAYALVPQGFAESLFTGENKKITYVMAESGASMSALLSRDVLEVVSNYIVETQIGATAMCSYARAQGSTQEEINTIDVELSLEYINMIAQRESLVEIRETGLGDNLSFAGYYICVLTVFFLLCFGIACCTLRTKHDYTLEKVLYAKGYGVVVQTAGEYLPYFAAGAVTLLIPYALAGAVSQFVEFGVPELEYLLPSDYLLLPVKLIPAVFLITALQFLLYELVTGMVNGVLLQFVAAVAQGYVSGCFYPVYFLPEAVQKTAAVLPTGVAIDYVTRIFTDRPVGIKIAVCLLYGMALLALSGTMRKVRLCAVEGQG